MAQLQWFPGHMAKAKRQIEEKIKLIDLIIEIVDARVPYSSQNPLLSKITINKPRVIIMSKVDMADKEQTELWAEYYKKMGFLVFATNLIDFSKSDFAKIKELANKSMVEKREREKRRGIRPRAIRAMIIGIPNVGKSTLINKLANKQKTIVGNKPGVTKAQQWIKVDKEFELLDTPGILQPKFQDETVAMNLALTNAIKQDILPTQKVFCGGVKFLYKEYRQVFVKLFGDAKIDVEDDNAIELIIGEATGLQKNATEFEEFCKDFLYQLQNGKIGKLTFDRM